MTLGIIIVVLFVEGGNVRIQDEPELNVTFSERQTVGVNERGYAPLSATRRSSASALGRIYLLGSYKMGFFSHSGFNNRTTL